MAGPPQVKQTIRSKATQARAEPGASFVIQSEPGRTYDVFTGYTTGPNGERIPITEQVPHTPPERRTQTVKVPQYLKDIEALFPGAFSQRQVSEPVYGFSESGRSRSAPSMRRYMRGWPGTLPIGQVVSAEATPLNRRTWIQAYASTTGNLLVADMMAESVTRDPLLRSFAKNAYTSDSPAAKQLFANAVREQYPELYDDATFQQMYDTQGLRQIVTTERSDAMGRATNDVQEASDKLYQLAMSAPGTDKLNPYRVMQEEIYKSHVNQRPAYERATAMYKMLSTTLTKMPASRIRDPALRAEAQTWESQVHEAMKPLDLQASDSSINQLTGLDRTLVLAAAGKIPWDESVMDALGLWPTPERLGQVQFPRTVVSDMGALELEQSAGGSTAAPYYPEQVGRELPRQSGTSALEPRPGSSGATEELWRTLKFPLGTESGDFVVGPDPAPGLSLPGQTVLPRGGSAMDPRSGMMEGQKSWPQVPSKYDQARYQERMVIAPQHWAGEAIRRSIEANNMQRAQQFWEKSYWKANLPKLEFTDSPRRNATIMLEAIVSDPELTESVTPSGIARIMAIAGISTDTSVTAAAYAEVRGPNPRAGLLMTPSTQTLIQAALHSQLHPESVPANWAKFGRIDSFGAASSEAAIMSQNQTELTRTKAMISAIGGTKYSDMNIPSVSEYGTFMGNMHRGAVDAAEAMTRSLGRGWDQQIDTKLMAAAARDSLSFRPGDRSVGDKPPLMLDPGEQPDTPSYISRINRVAERDANGMVTAHTEAMHAWYESSKNAKVTNELADQYPSLTEGQRISRGISEGVIAAPIDKERYVQHQIAKKFISELYSNIVYAPWTEEKRVDVIGRIQSYGFAIPDWLAERQLRDEFRSAKSGKGSSLGDRLANELANAPQVLDSPPQPD